ncbi:MAG: ABC transporter permease [Spirochaetaceae bacterium]
MFAVFRAPRASWTRFLGGRYMQTAGNLRGHASVRLSIIGIAAGVMTLITVLSVMNGFQNSTIQSILEVSSYHLRLESEELSALSDSRLDSLRDAPEVRAVVPFVDVQALARGFFQQPDTVLLRGVPQDLFALDRRIAERIEIVEGRFDLSRERSVVIGAELARSVGAGVGDAISLVHLPDSAAGAARPDETQMVVAGVFRTGYLDFDRSWAFISLETASQLFDAPVSTIGVKLENRFQEARAAAALEEALRGSEVTDPRIVSWREFNRGIFGALRVEKSMMLLLVGLIFLVVAVNIFHTLNRSVAERQEEIALLRALGATPREVTSVFLGQGVTIGFIGASSGLLLGLFLSVNINAVFEAAELLINGAISLLSWVSRGARAGQGVEIFSARDFYLAEVPVEIRFLEAVMIYLFAVFSATLAGYGASRRVSAVSPASLLREEARG